MYNLILKTTNDCFWSTKESINYKWISFSNNLLLKQLCILPRKLACSPATPLLGPVNHAFCGSWATNTTGLLLISSPSMYPWIFHSPAMCKWNRKYQDLRKVMQGSHSSYLRIEYMCYTCVSKSNIHIITYDVFTVLEVSMSCFIHKQKFLQLEFSCLLCSSNCLFLSLFYILTYDNSI